MSKKKTQKEEPRYFIAQRDSLSMYGNESTGIKGDAMSHVITDGCPRDAANGCPPKLKQMWRVWKYPTMPKPETAIETKSETANLKDTESAALDAARKYACEQEARWYGFKQAIDVRVDEIETEEMKRE